MLGKHAFSTRATMMILAAALSMTAFAADARSPRLSLSIAPAGEIESLLPPPVAKEIVSAYSGSCKRSAVYDVFLNGRPFGKGSMIVITGCLIGSGEMIWSVGNPDKPKLLHDEDARKLWKVLYPYPDYTFRIVSLDQD